jgi:hypothetical protein
MPSLTQLLASSTLSDVQARCRRAPMRLLLSSALGCDPCNRPISLTIRRMTAVGRRNGFSKRGSEEGLQLMIILLLTR